MKVSFIRDSYKRFNEKHRVELDVAWNRCVSNGSFILQEDVEGFERNFAHYVGSKYCVGVNSGTDAMYLSLWALGIGKGDEVLVPSHTFVATVQVVVQLGATPILY